MIIGMLSKQSWYFATENILKKYADEKAYNNYISSHDFSVEASKVKINIIRTCECKSRGLSGIYWVIMHVRQATNIG